MIKSKVKSFVGVVRAKKFGICAGEKVYIGKQCALKGKHCVIGANSVVTRDIPDYSVAVGSPARVIKEMV
ncbi:MAG: hypothetical protein ACI4EF_06535 [Coprococcus sp.]